MENELKTNAKRMTGEEKYQLHKQIIRMWKQGHKPAQIAQMVGVTRQSVYNNVNAYEAEGIAGIKVKKIGRPKGSGCKLSEEQQWEIRRILVDKTPDQLKFADCMWSRENVGELIRQKYGIDMPVSTMGDYLRRWGFSVQRPVKRAYKQDEKAVKAWVEVEFPGINKRAEEEDADIYFGDEVGVQNQPNNLRGYSPIGKTPVVKTEAKRLRINMLSAVSCRGKLRFMIYKDTMNAAKLIDFFKRLIKDTPRKVFLILDNLRVHHAKIVRAWLDAHKDEIEVFYLPSYAPEYNPDEFLNSDLKRSLSKKLSPHTEQELEKNIRAHLAIVRDNPAKICGFFQAPTTAYAA